MCVSIPAVCTPVVNAAGEVCVCGEVIPCGCGLQTARCVLELLRHPERLNNIDNVG